MSSSARNTRSGTRTAAFEEWSTAERNRAPWRSAVADECRRREVQTSVIRAVAAALPEARAVAVLSRHLPAGPDAAFNIQVNIENVRTSEIAGGMGIEGDQNGRAVQGGRAREVYLFRQAPEVSAMHYRPSSSKCMLTSIVLRRPRRRTCLTCSKRRRSKRLVWQHS